MSGPDDTADPVIELRDLAVELGDRRVLEGISVAAPRGSLVGVVGPNGAGKTTLLRAINGVLEPAAGAVLLDGRRGEDLSSRARSRLVATVPQSTELSFEFSVREVVGMARTPHLSRFDSPGAADEAAVERALERTAVAGLADRPITEISGGERSRVLLARALAAETPVLALDEPTASLDINHQRRTLALVRDLVADGRTAVAAIHDLDLAARFCDRLVVLADGRVVAAGSPEAVLEEPTVRRAFGTPAAIGRAPETDTPRVTALPERDGTASGRVHVVGGGGRATRFLHALAGAGYDLSVGPLHGDDPDAETARRLGIDAVTVPPLAGPDVSARQALRGHLEDADAVLVADAPVSDGNLEFLRAVAGGGSTVLVGTRPFEERNHAGEAGRRLYGRLRRSARVAQPDGVVDAVAAAVEADSGRVAADD